jgi:hypothetical protein
VAGFGRRARLAILLLPLIIAAPALLIHGPLPQDLGYHAFADQRSWLGIPNAGNVLTNAFFLLAGVLGLGFVLGGKTRNAFLDPRERGDVRLYGVVEFYPLVAIPLLLLLFPPRYTGTSFLLSMAGAYLAALLFEALDGPILRWTGAVSGHSLKHAAAAAACFLVIPLLARRSAVTASPTCPSPPES